MNHRCLVALCACLLGLLTCGSGLRAGGGPENVLLVVNAEDETSRMVANWYQRVREIPDSNVLFLPGIPRRHSITWPEYRSLVLEPVFRTVSERKLDQQIDYVVYSTGFPTQVAIDDHQFRFLEIFDRQNKEGNVQARSIFGPVASFTSMTYFATQALADNPSYLGFFSNNYFRRPMDEAMKQPFGGARQEQYEQGVNALLDGDYERAAALFKPLAEANPGQMVVQFRLAQAWGGQGDVDQTARALGSAIRAGWCFRKHTRENQHLRKVVDAPLVAGLIGRIPDEPFEFMPTMGGSFRVLWGPNGGPNAEPGQGTPYLMSTMLGTHWDHGNGEGEIVNCIRTSAAADYSRPAGTFYFSRTEDIRSKTRIPAFGAAIQRLRQMGERAEEINGIFPPVGKKVAGISLGTPEFSWLKSGCEILPGAICENLTSWGANYTLPDQTKLSEFIRYGAAGTSGTVFEPFAIQFKFPHPMIHVHYARGCNLAESFYQSVSGPFQLLILGDALCQPWARPPVLKVTGLKEEGEVEGLVQLSVETVEGSPAVALTETYLDGRLVGRSAGTGNVGFDSRQLPDGWHELRVVGVDTTPIQTRGRQIIPFVVNNRGQSVQLTCSRPEARIEESFELEVDANLDGGVEILHAGELVGRVEGRKGTVRVEAVRLGRGPVRVVAVARDDAGRPVSSAPLLLHVRGEMAKKPIQLPKAN